MKKRDERQMELGLRDAPKLRVIDGLGQKKREKLGSREAVARVLVGAGADLLLRRISPERAEVIERAVDEVMALFDSVDRTPALLPVLERKLNDLEALVRESENRRPVRLKG